MTKTYNINHSLSIYPREKINKVPGCYQILDLFTRAVNCKIIDVRDLREKIKHVEDNGFPEIIEYLDKNMMKY